jgi:formate-dependent nitrite reductase membrane component NrfD
VRKPEQGTSPKVFYVEGEDVALHPTAIVERPPRMMWGDVADHRAVVPRKRLPVVGSTGTASSGVAIRTPRAQGVPAGGPVRTGGRMAEHMVQVAYDAQHRIAWHWPVPAYLVTKAIGSGIFGFLTLGWLSGWFRFDPAAMLWGGALSIAAILATTALLVIDLERPERFLSIVLRPQWKSWLARGAFLLIAFATVSGAWWAAEAAQQAGMWVLGDAVRTTLAWLTLPLSVGAAIYTAFLFAQAEGRDLWQSPLLPVHLLVQALVMGSGAFLLIAPFVELSPELVDVARVTFAASLLADLFLILAAELGIPHASDVAAAAAHEIVRGKHARSFWLHAIGLGHALPLMLWASGVEILGAVAFAFAALGLYAYEHAFVMAPQEIPNS